MRQRGQSTYKRDENVPQLFEFGWEGGSRIVHAPFITRKNKSTRGEGGVVNGYLTYSVYLAPEPRHFPLLYVSNLPRIVS